LAVNFQTKKEHSEQLERQVLVEREVQLEVQVKQQVVRELQELEV
jgi:hypothetical protein